jgi:hypothetical protein
MNKGGYLNRCTSTNNRLLLGVALKLKLQLAYHFGFFELAKSLSEDIASLQKERSVSSVAMINTYAWYTFAAYVCLEKHRATGRRRYLKQYRHYKRRIGRKHGGC